MNLGSRFVEQKAVLDKGIDNMSLEEIQPMLCGKSHGNADVCVECQSSCAFGRRAVEIKYGGKQMTKRMVYATHKKIEAMSNYIEAMKSDDPVKFVTERYGCENERVAKNKIYQWQHNYGKNLGMIANKIREMELEIAASAAQTTEESSETKNAEIEAKSRENSPEEKKTTKKEEKEISKNHLEQMRRDLERECLKLEDEITEHKKAIERCENRINEIAEESQAIRQVLDIFNKPRRGSKQNDPT